MHLPKGVTKSIIDEVHTFVGAFNALLKTLEGATEHVKFILLRQRPESSATILSRCQRSDLHRIPANRSRHFGFIAKRCVATCGARARRRGGLRCESMLDQLVAFCGEKSLRAMLNVFNSQ
jgi:DNA polymerase III gamma/tau subunit